LVCKEAPEIGAVLAEEGRQAEQLKSGSEVGITDGHAYFCIRDWAPFNLLLLFSVCLLSDGCSNARVMCQSSSGCKLFLKQSYSFPDSPSLHVQFKTHPTASIRDLKP